MVGSDARVPRTARADGGAKDEAAMETAEIIPERECVRPDPVLVNFPCGCPQGGVTGAGQDAQGG